MVLFADQSSQQSLGEIMRSEEEKFPPGISRRNFLSSFLLSTTTTSSLLCAPHPVIASSGNPIENKVTDKNKINHRSKFLEEGISGFIAGSALTTTKTFVKYPLDTATVRLQMPSKIYQLASINDIPPLFQGSFRGIMTPLITNIPGGAVFFAVKDATKSFIKENYWSLPKWAVTALAVGVALPPYWLIRNPSEVIKTRQQAGLDGYGEGVSAWTAYNSVYQKSQISNANSTLGGVKDFYQGYGENMIYSLPADVIKFVVYDGYASRILDRRREQDSSVTPSLSPLEGAAVGAFATAVAQFMTTPLDVVRNRAMMESKQFTATKREMKQPGNSYLDSIIDLKNKEGISGLFAGASPRVVKALLSGAIQFATYEETKASIRFFFERK